MTETKKIPTRVLLTITTGLSLPGAKFDHVHEAIKHLLGEPVWTHQLASPEPWAKAREAIIAQHPAFASVDGDALRSACEGKANDARVACCEEWTAKQVEILGAPGFAIAKGNGRDPAAAQDDAIESLREIAKDKPVLVVGCP